MGNGVVYYNTWHYLKGAVLLRTTRPILHTFGDPGQSFCSILTKIRTEGAFMCLRMMMKGFFANINLKPTNRVKGSQGVVELFTE